MKPGYHIQSDAAALFWSTGLRPGSVVVVCGSCRVGDRRSKTNQGRLQTSVLILCLLCLVSGAFAQTLKFPPRGTNMPGGKAFAEKISALSFAEREQEFFSQVTAGNVPAFLRKLCPVTVTNVAAGITNVATFYAAPEYLAIGSDEDYFLIPMCPARRSASPTNLAADCRHAKWWMRFTLRRK